MSIETLWTLVTVVGVILGTVLVILIAIRVIPLSDKGPKYKTITIGSGVLSDTPLRDSSGRPASGDSDTRSRS